MQYVIFIPEGGYGALGPAMLVYRENTTPIIIKHSSRYEALPRNVIFVALPLNGGRASEIAFPGRAWERSAGLFTVHPVSLCDMK